MVKPGILLLTDAFIIEEDILLWRCLRSAMMYWKCVENIL